MVGIVAGVGLADAGAFGPPPLLELLRPAFDNLFGDNRMIEATVVAIYETAQRAGAMLLPCALIAAQTDQAHQHRVVIGQTAGRDLVPRRRPQQDGVPARFGLLLGRQIAVAQPRHVQRHEREVLQVAISRGQGRGMFSHRHGLGDPAPRCPGSLSRPP